MFGSRPFRRQLRWARNKLRPSTVSPILVLLALTLLLLSASVSFRRKTRRTCTRPAVAPWTCVPKDEEEDRYLKGIDKYGDLSYKDTRCQKGLDCDFMSVCLGERKSVDAITYLVQKKHSSYDEEHKSWLFFQKSLELLSLNYKKVDAVDVLIFHEGDVSEEDFTLLQGIAGEQVNLRSCLLSCCSGWGPPVEPNPLPPEDKGQMRGYSLGYLLMIRFFGKTIWKMAEELGYEWVMRLDDDSFIHSPIRYNLFDRMREGGYTHGYRNQFTFFGYECSTLHVLFSTARGERLKEKYDFSDFCVDFGNTGPYNNFFISEVQQWLSPATQEVLDAYDASGVMFSHRLNDIIGQSIALQLTVPREKMIHLEDFSYEHTTVTQNGLATCGGLDIGTLDEHASGLRQELSDRFPTANEVGNGYSYSVEKKCVFANTHSSPTNTTTSLITFGEGCSKLHICNGTDYFP